jgi:hypothetical protein
VALVRTDNLEERIASFIRVTRIGELGTTSTVFVPKPPILVTPMKKAICSSETSTFTRAARRHIPEDDIPHKLRMAAR